MTSVANVFFFTLGDMPFEEYSALLERLGDESEQTDANMEVDIGLNAEVKTAAVEKSIFLRIFIMELLCCAVAYSYCLFSCII